MAPSLMHARALHHGTLLLQADIAKAEAQAAQLQQQLSASEASVSSKAAELELLQKTLEGAQQELSKTSALVTERDSKVPPGCAPTGDS
jgi:multidrug resistance efflux pump